MGNKNQEGEQSTFLVNVGGDTGLVRFSTKKKDHKRFKLPSLRRRKPAEGSTANLGKYAQDRVDRARGSGGVDPETGEE